MPRKRVLLGLDTEQQLSIAHDRDRAVVARVEPDDQHRDMAVTPVAVRRTDERFPALPGSCTHLTYRAVSSAAMRRPCGVRSDREHPDSPVRPFNFVSAAYMRPLARVEPVRLFAPFVSEPARAHEADWYVQGTGERIEITTDVPHGVIVEGVIPVKTYGDLLFDYAYHPEVKFADREGKRCQPTTVGRLQRRHIIATRVEPIGKEGNALNRRVEGTGLADEMQQLYADPWDFKRYVVPVASAMRRPTLAKAVGMTERGLRKILNGHSGGTPASRTAMAKVAGLWAARQLGWSPGANPLDDCAAWLAKRVRY